MSVLAIPSPDDRETISLFLHETTGLHIDGVSFAKHADGLMMRVGYRDKRGYSHTKRLTAPDARSIEDIVVLMSEWLSHGVTDHLDAARSGVGHA